MSTSAEQAAPAQVSAEDFAEILRATRACVRERVVPRETEIMDKDEVPTDIRVSGCGARAVRLPDCPV